MGRKSRRGRKVHYETGQVYGPRPPGGGSVLPVLYAILRAVQGGPGSKNVNLAPMNLGDYRRWLTHQQHMKAVRDVYYPSWQAEWG